MIYLSCRLNIFEDSINIILGKQFKLRLLNRNGINYIAYLLKL